MLTCRYSLADELSEFANRLLRVVDKVDTDVRGETDELRARIAEIERQSGTQDSTSALEARLDQLERQEEASRLRARVEVLEQKLASQNSSSTGPSLSVPTSSTSSPRPGPVIPHASSYHPYDGGSNSRGRPQNRGRGRGGRGGRRMPLPSGREPGPWSRPPPLFFFGAYRLGNHFDSLGLHEQGRKWRAIVRWSRDNYPQDEPPTTIRGHWSAWFKRFGRRFPGVSDWMKLLPDNDPHWTRSELDGIPSVASPDREVVPEEMCDDEGNPLSPEAWVKLQKGAAPR